MMFRGGGAAWRCGWSTDSLLCLSPTPLTSHTHMHAYLLQLAARRTTLARARENFGLLRKALAHRLAKYEELSEAVHRTANNHFAKYMVGGCVGQNHLAGAFRCALLHPDDHGRHQPTSCLMAL